MTAGASKAATTITPPALVSSPLSRPAPTSRALPSNRGARRGQNWTPMRGQIYRPIDSQKDLGHRQVIACWPHYSHSPATVHGGNTPWEHARPVNRSAPSSPRPAHQHLELTHWEPSLTSPGDGLF